MKRVPERVAIDLPPVRLFLEDLDFLVERLSQGMEAHIKHGPFAYDSLNEVESRTQRKEIHQIELSAHRRNEGYGSISVIIEPAGVRIYADDDLSDLGRSIAEYLRARVPWYAWRPSRGSWWYGLRGVLEIALIMALVFTVLTAFPFGPIGNVAVGAIISLAVFALLGFDRTFLGQSVLFLSSSTNRLTFWERHRDAVILQIISGLITGAIGFILGRVTH